MKEFGVMSEVVSLNHKNLDDVIEWDDFKDFLLCESGVRKDAIKNLVIIFYC